MSLTIDLAKWPDDGPVMQKSTMAKESTLRFGAQTDEVTSLLRIVNMVRAGDASTRPEIGRVTGLGRGVVTQRVDHAIEMGYLEDGEFGPSSGGRAPRTLRFRGDRGRIVVCALGALHIHVGVAMLEGDILEQTAPRLGHLRGPGRDARDGAGMIDEVLARTPDVPVWGIAVGVPGPVDFASGRPVAPPIMPGWNGFDMRRRFEERYEAPVWVDNDVNLLALSERSRRGDEHLDLIYCKIGSGIGAGLLSQGRIHRGANGAAGDIGHVRVAGSDALCRCGKVGCLEAVAGGWALVRDAEVAVAEGATGALAQRTPRVAAHARGHRPRRRGRRRARDLADPALRPRRRRVDRRARQHVQPRHDRDRRCRRRRGRGLPRRGAPAGLRAVAAARDA